MTPRRTWLLAAGLAALAGARAAAPPPGQRRLGVLLFDRPQSWAFLPPELRQALAELGWVEGKNLSIDWRYAEGDAARLPALAAALASSGVGAILTRGTPATRALQQATTTVPILTGVGDPIGAGFARSYAQPGGNITGISYAMVETQSKQLELLREMLPRLARLTIVLQANRQAFAQEITRVYQATAQAVGITTRLALIEGVGGLGRALQSAGASGTYAAFVFGFGKDIDPAVFARIALQAGVPTMFDQRFYVDVGGLMSYRLDWDNQTQRTAAQIDKVFRGEKPAQIPFELPTRSEFVLNARTAKALGLTIPHALRVRADEVIE